jgi:hypothetical protein
MGDVVTIFDQVHERRSVAVKFEYGGGGFSLSEYPTLQDALKVARNFVVKRNNQYKNENRVPLTDEDRETNDYLGRLGT